MSYIQRSPKGHTMHIFIDGLCEPSNPDGFACWGMVVLNPDGTITHEERGFVGQGAGMSNNIAEYHALIRALQWCVRQGASHPSLQSDSQLIVNQVHGTWQCRKEHLKPLCAEAQKLLTQIQGTLTWIPREENAQADKLSREAYSLARQGRLTAQPDISCGEQDS